MGKGIKKDVRAQELRPVSLSELIRRSSAAASTSSATSSEKRRSMRWPRSETTSTASSTRPANANAARAADITFERTWAKRCPGVVTSLREGGHELLTFFQFPKRQWKTLRTTNGIERLHEEFRRRVKTQGSLPSEDAAVVLLFSRVASGADQVAPDRRLAEDRYGAQSAHGGGGMMIVRAALAATLAFGLLAVPLAAEAQTKVPRIGVLLTNSRTSHLTDIEGFRLGLRERGYVEGRDIAIEYRYGDGKLDRLPRLAAELVGLHVDLIVTSGTPPTRAAQQATQTTPIVMTLVGNPIAAGFVASLAKPGGNITGLTTLTAELGGKRLELLKDALPTVSRVAVLVDPEVIGLCKTPG